MVFAHAGGRSGGRIDLQQRRCTDRRTCRLAVKATRKLYRSIRKDDLYGGPRGATPTGNDATKTPLKTIPEDRLAE